MNKWTYSIFIAYLVLGIYVLTVTIKIPFIGILVDPSSGQLVIDDLYYPDWAQQQNLEIGDILLTIDKEPAHKNSSIHYYSVARSAKELTIIKSSGVVHSITVQHQDIPEELYLQIIFPVFYFVLSLGVALYLWKKNKKDQKRTKKP